MAKKEITDFGSKIGGARKDVWIKKGKKNGYRNNLKL